MKLNKKEFELRSPAPASQARQFRSVRLGPVGTYGTAKSAESRGDAWFWFEAGSKTAESVGPGLSLCFPDRLGEA